MNQKTHAVQVKKKKKSCLLLFLSRVGYERGCEKWGRGRGGGGGGGGKVSAKPCKKNKK